MNHAFICKSVPSCDIFFCTRMQKSRTQLSLVFPAFFFLWLFPFSAVFVFLLQLLSVYWAFSQLKNFFEKASSRNSYQVVKREIILQVFHSGFSMFLYIFEGQSLCLGIIVWFLLLQQFFH